MSEQIKQELHQHLTHYDETYYGSYGFVRTSRSVYRNLFMEPVKQLFYWEEEDWQGSIFALYEYSSYFVVVKGFFGSCSGCDPFEGATYEEVNERLQKIVTHAELYKDIRAVELSKYSHPDLVQEFEKFRQEFVKNNL